jgi:hypothetical protein
MLFDGLKGFDIEAVGKWEFVKLRGDGFGLQGVNPPEGQVDIRGWGVAAFGPRAKKFDFMDFRVPIEHGAYERGFPVGERGHFCSSSYKN